ncbi:hypothetical protein H310_10948 [Aphanomyces invadans]|uniref:ADP-ribosylation factor-like protein 16 n=1 Tax=Aphanomyces invadans TaxID=157072 RepID=A0A024TMV1_9STRA|nr:hypothetical protein H310_10948 [Aphanomyces invadans]ETV95470.1 hypothetical protein H310_10948 [Aphanomyces invadans]|eukprot:XP_008875663.1 hypothetical protein H310_10948 [Aphanomyces invadans]
MKVGLVLGLDGAGKTVLLRQLSRICKDNARTHPELGSVFEKVYTHLFSHSTPHDVAPEDTVNVATVPTTGVEEETISYRSMTVTLREVGAPMLTMWKSYFESSDFFMFVVDMTNFPQLATAAVEFFNVLHAPAMQGKMGFLLFNKIDAPCTVPTQWLRSLFSLDQVCASMNIYVIQISATTGDHLDTLLSTMAAKMQPMRYSQRLSQFRDPSQNRVYPTTHA